jgi:creatinine amidohydrolase/Fe(II)-dependent formamide hydrolase-like protein
MTYKPPLPLSSKALLFSSWQPQRRALKPSGLTVALLPVGCVEQHGPFLPVQTDSLLAEGFARLVAEDLGRKKLVARSFPPIHFTPTETNAGYSGTVSIGADVFAGYADAVCRALLGQFDAVVIVNAHGPAEFRLKEIAFGLVHQQFSGGVAKPKPVFVISCYEYDQQLGKLFGLAPGRHADWREFLCLYHLYGPELFPDSTLKEMHAFQKKHDFSVERSAILGVPMQYRSVQGVQGDPFPFEVDQVPSLADRAWNFIQRNLTEKIAVELKAFVKKKWRG